MRTTALRTETKRPNLQSYVVVYVLVGLSGIHRVVCNLKYRRELKHFTDLSENRGTHPVKDKTRAVLTENRTVTSIQQHTILLVVVFSLNTHSYFCWGNKLYFVYCVTVALQCNIPLLVSCPKSSNYKIDWLVYWKLSD